MRIDVLPHGPYKVSGGVPLSIMSIQRNEAQEAIGWKEVEVLPTKDLYMLCRCGHSKNKPFCDGAHVAAGFDGTETAGHEPFERGAEIIKGDVLSVHDKMNLCIGAEFCDRLGGVWNLATATEEDFADRGAEKAAQLVQKAHKVAIQQACDCPSGRLVIHKTADGEAIEANYDKPGIALIQDPDFGTSCAIWVRGGIPVYDEHGEPYEIRNRVTLCRCGASRHKPFCNGAHYQIDFKDGLAS